MGTKDYKDGVTVRAYQHGGERAGYGRPIRSEVVLAKTGKRTLSVTIYVGDQRRAAVIVELEPSILAAAGQALSAPAT